MQEDSGQIVPIWQGMLRVGLRHNIFVKLVMGPFYFDILFAISVPQEAT